MDHESAGSTAFSAFAQAERQADAVDLASKMGRLDASDLR